MKKQVFGLIAALFVCAVLLPVGARATDTNAAGVYAILYEDGTLVFQNGNTPEPGRTVTNTYEVDLTAVYRYPSYGPWYNERESIRVVSFTDRVSPTSTVYWFCDCHNLERVDNIQNLDTANVTSMFGMFNGCSGLTALDVSHFNTANVTDMGEMFFACSGLTALDVSHFDTANVTNMSHMFQGCNGLTALDVSNFDTANVTSMFGMFKDCSGLMALDVSHFDTANVTNMSTMFSGCSALTALDVSHFDTANVKEMATMFSSCSALTALDVSNFDTAKVWNMIGMFKDCSGLMALDVSHFDTANVRNMHTMFSGCSGLTALDVSNFDTVKVEGAEKMFSSCSNLKTIYASDKFTTASVPETKYYNSRNMFADCTSLVGGNGTTFDENHTDKEYARIDTADASGYFTAKDAAPVAYAITSLTANNSTGKLTVLLTNPAAATVIVSYFDTQGQFLTADWKSVPANAGSVELTLMNVRSARVTMLDEAYRPLCRPYVAVLGR